MDCFINLYEFCGNINLSGESVMFFIDEGIICVENRENEFYIDKKTADELIFISQIKNELGINDEGVSVMLNLRGKVIDYQNMLSTVFSAIKTSKSIDELIFLLERSEYFMNILTNSKEL